MVIRAKPQQQADLIVSEEGVLRTEGKDCVWEVVGEVDLCIAARRLESFETGRCAMM